MSFLGDYYSSKFQAAVALAFYKNTGNTKYKEEATNYLTQAIEHWRKYRDININRYKPQNFARLRTFDWNNQLKWVKKDVDIAKNIKTYQEETSNDIDR